jgi:hypothetical protein
MNSLRGLGTWILLVGSAAAVAGCSESVTSKDVDAARKKANEEHLEADRVRAQSPDQVDKVREEDAEAREADRKLRETEMKAAATSARDAYVTGVEANLSAADIRIDAMKKSAAAQQGVAKDAADRQIDDMKARRDRLQDALSKLKTADLIEWQQHRPEVERLLSELTVR